MPTQSNKTPNIEQSLLDACIHCGLCLPACPTYLATGRELESPRGRISLLNLWQQGKESFSARMAEHLDSCLGCLGCQTACPSGVNYEAIINQARPSINAIKPGWEKFFKRIIFSRILNNDQLLYLLARFLFFWQKHQLGKLSSNLANQLYLDKLPPVKTLLGWQALLPHIPEHKALNRLTTNPGRKIAIVQLFKGCIMDIFYNQVNQAAIELLNRQAQIVAVPKQTCCGALALHAGLKNIAVQLAKQNIEDFASNEGPIIITASGCAAMLKTYPELFDEDDPWHNKAAAFSQRVQDLPEFLINLSAAWDFSSISPTPPCSTTFSSVARSGLSDQSDQCIGLAGIRGLYPDRQFNSDHPLCIAYHAACHLAHAQGIHLAPKQLLEDFARSVNKKNKRETIRLIPLMEEEHCCGSAGIYNLSHPTLSNMILARKMVMIKETGADLIVTTNPGCLLQLEAGLRNEGLSIKVVHLAEVLAVRF